MSQRQGDLTCDNLPDPQALSSQNLNLNETHAPAQTHTLTQEHCVSQGEAIGACKPPLSHSNNNGEDEDTYSSGGRENEEEDELMKEEEDKLGESSDLIRCQSPDTPMTDSSFSETGSLLETPFSPGTSPEPLCPLNPGASYPLHSPVEPSQWDPDVDSHFSTTGSGDAGHLTKEEMEVEQTDSEPGLSRKMQPIASSAGRDHLDGIKQLTAGEESTGASNAKERGGDHMAPPITEGTGIPPAAGGGMDQSKPAERQGVEGEATPEKEDRGEERETCASREDAHVLEMEAKGGGGGEEEMEEVEEGAEDVPEETELFGVEDLIPLLQQEAVTQDNQWEVIQLCLNSQLVEDLAQLQQELNGKHEEQDYGPGIIKEAYHLDDQAKLITIEEVTPASGLVSILKKRSVCASESSESIQAPAKRRVRFKVADDGYDQEVGGGDSCLLLFLLCFVTVVISIGGTALYCVLGDAHSTVCQDFSLNADFYVGQLQRGVSHLQHWLTSGS
ncbi:hypothetical protein NHX12_005927 [Muraenolepis orangiensis]|uniref:Consortin C-terminal domain-containing protein n=1 Tax=Muraenolepis orangiensis TaxID=630683 RepID=A0A9Q0IDB9_9TELE|nr:hypothetical protein NHX12_005927 [Muraenolepis orangiensis]